MCLDLSHIRLLLCQRQYDSAARALRQLPDTTRRLQAHTTLMLSSSVMCGLGNYTQGPA